MTVAASPDRFPAMKTTQIMTGLISGQRPVDGLGERPLFAQNEASFRREREVSRALGVFLQTDAVLVVRGETLEGDEPPSDVVSPLVRHEVSDEPAATPGNDTSPSPSVLSERLFLERVNSVTDEARDRHAPKASLRTR